MSIQQQSVPAAQRVDSLEASVDLLMSLFAMKPSVWLAQAVLSHLESLTALPIHLELNEERRINYQQLLPAWQGIVRRLAAMESVMSA
jgi:hypothetical protein